MGFCSPTKEPYVLGAVALLVAFLSLRRTSWSTRTASM